MMKIDKLQLEIIIDNDEARQSLRKLEEESKQLKKELKKLPEGTDEWHRKKKKLAAIENQMESIRHEIGITGMSLKELGQRQRQLNMIMANMDPRLDEYKKLQKELRKVKERQGHLRKEANKTRFSFNKLANSFNKYFGIVTAGIAAVTGFTLAIQNMLNSSGKFADRLTDVQKTTNMTKEEVLELNRELKKINTRSSRSELLELSRIAGKLGIQGVTEVAGFVKEADQIIVALAEDLGGNVEETVRQVGKLVNIFKVDEELGLNKGLRSVGSAINALGAASTANEGYLVSFSKRFGGIAPNANISIQDTLGLAATLDQLGQTSEISTTSLGKLMVLLGKDVPKFAKIAGMSVKDFSKLLEEDANEAMIKVFIGAKSSKDGLEGMAESLDTMGVDGQRAIGVIGVLSNHIELLREQQALSNQEFDKATSLTEEFNKKNNNLAGVLAKIKKVIYSKIISPRLLSALERGARAVERWTRADFADTLSSESDQVSRLIVELTNSNTKEEQRRIILSKLKNISKTIVEGIDSENLSLETLKDNLKEYNSQLITRLTLSNLNKEEEEKLVELDKVREIQQNAKIDLSKLMIKANKELALSAGTFQEKYAKVVKYLNENASDQINLTSHHGFSDFRNEEEKMLDDINSLYGVYMTNLRKGNELESETEGIRKRNEELKKLLEISEIKEDSFELTADKLGTESLEELRKKLMLYKKALGEAEEGDDDFLRIKEKIKKVNQAIENWNNDPKKFKYQFTFDYNDLEVQANNIRKQVENFLETGTDESPLLGQAFMDLDIGEENQLEKVKTNAMYERELWQETYDGRIDMQREMLRKGIISEQEFKDKVIEIEREKREIQMELTSEAIGNMASVFAENTIAYKALASAQALINTYLAATKALTKGPIIGPILAATITAQGLVQVARINKIGVDKPKVSQAATGRYDVIGMDDNKLYQGVPFSSGDGILNNGKPTLINEKEGELLLNARHVKNIEMNYPDVEQAIKATYVPQRATGNYQPIERSQPALTVQQAAPVMDPRMVDLLERNTAAMEKISKEGVRGRWVYRDFEDFQNEVKSTKKTASRE